MNYREALDYVLQFADYERLPRSAVVFDLRRIALLLERLGNPQDTARAVHVAGTKGKGSTATMIASILKSSGYRTGLYTSPHLLSFTERLQVDGRPIAEADFARLVAQLQPEVATVNREAAFGELTTFEILTALAFVYFRECRVDYQVMETGLGGRLDATNVVRPEVCVLTSISYDHMDVLGNTLTLIAGEKAGIIKPGCPTVTAPQFPEAMAVLEKTVRERHAPLLKVGQDVTWRLQTFSTEGQEFTVQGRRDTYALALPLLGEYQLENAATAVAAAEVLAEKGAAKITPVSIAAGLKGINWPGRLQILHRQPWLVIDGAHNAYSAGRLVAALRKYFTYRRAWLIFGASGDKDLDGMVAELAPFPDEVIVTVSRHPRSVKADVLAAAFARHGARAETATDVAGAVKAARARAAKDDLICATGSIFIIAEVLEYLGPAGKK
ncbi:MAG: folylpolyglutamate synthase/dihydrofolate synthase family protein [Chloroflexota bacterium]